MNRIIYIIVALTFTLLCCSCRIGQVHKLPDINMPTEFAKEDLQNGAAADIGWSTMYSDAILQELITKALDSNKDLLIASARIKEMIANKRINFSKLFPDVNLSIGAERDFTNYAGDNKVYDSELTAGGVIAWELDVWGKLRWQNEAGIAAYLQSVEAQQALKLTIVAQVAQTYFELKALDRELNIVRQTLDARREGVRFAKLRYEGGLTSEIPYRQSLVELARTETLVPTLENEIKLKENDLSLLIGEFPTEIIRGKDSPLLAIPNDLPIELPSSLLQRRPDVRLAEQQLREANAKVGIALTSMFPSIKLTVNLGLENTELTDFLKSPAWLISGAITGPIFNMGRNRAAHKAAQAVYEQEVYAYEKKILDVFREVNSAITTFVKTKEMYKSAEALYESAKTYHELARLQYVNGVINYIDVLDAQRQLFDAEISLNDALLNELTTTVNLYKVLGGGVIR